jgi:diguanylate cyclase (GGDEF)-like protein
MTRFRPICCELPRLDSGRVVDSTQVRLRKGQPRRKAGTQSHGTHEVRRATESWGSCMRREASPQSSIEAAPLAVAGEIPQALAASGEQVNGAPPDEPPAAADTGPVWRLTCLLAATVAAGWWAFLRGLEAPIVIHDAAFIVIAALFTVGELAVVHVPRSRSTASHSLREIPAALALLLLTPSHYIETCICGSAVALLFFVRQRGVKLCFNLATFAFEAFLAVAIYRSFAVDSPLGVAGWLAAMTAVMIAHTVGTLLVDVAIHLAGDPLDPAAALRSACTTAVSAIANTSVALLSILLVTREPLALPLVAVPIGALFFAVHAYSSLARRFTRLRVLYRVVGRVGDASAPSLDEAADAAIADARQLLGTYEAEVYLVPGRVGWLYRMARGEGEHAETNALAGPSPWWREALDGGPVVTVREESGRPALAVPMRLDGEVRGVLATSDPIAATTIEFDADDVRMFETLAAHTIVSLHRAALSDDLRREVRAREHEARHDNLTGLLNRREFVRLMDDDPRRSAGVLMVVDLDDFHEVNSGLGHEAGDRVLLEVGRRLTAATGGPVARLGGDEFVAFLPDTTGRSDAHARAQTVLASLSDPILVDGVPVLAHATAGVATLDVGMRANAALADADTALWQAKSSHEPLDVFVDQPTAERGRRRLRLASDLPQALRNRTLTVAFQPQMDVSSGNVTSAEALARWTHPVLGVIPPPEFVAIAERTGLMRQLTLGVLDQALTASVSWAARGRRVGVAVNVSTQDLQDVDFPDDVEEMLARRAVEPALLTLEITETGVMSDPARCVAVLDRLADTGVRLSVDDFGTGYSSLAYLDRLPVHEVKIDRSFVNRLAACPNDSAIVRSIIELGHALGLSVIAEGVETPGVLEQLTDLGVDFVQGYYVAHPAAADSIVRAVPAARALT